ncbi:tRNA-binding protein [Candidatus Microgenomates bacterium]|nr:tRNA-binding protein [Candidatus Microgenomates bacterium]
MVSFSDFQQLDIRVGRILAVENFPEALKPSYKLTIDFGTELGKRTSSAQLTKYYDKQELIGKKILVLINIPARQIGPFYSQVLTLGVPDENGQCILIVPDLPNAIVGGKVF